MEDNVFGKNKYKIKEMLPICCQSIYNTYEIYKYIYQWLREEKKEEDKKNLYYRVVM